VRGRRDLAHLAQQFDVGRGVIEEIVADHAAKGLTAELSVFLLVDALENRALIPGGTLVALEGLTELHLADVQHADLQHLVRLGVVDQVVQPAPGALELLKVRVVQDLIDLLAELLVDLGDHRRDRLNDVSTNQLGLRQRLLGQGADRFFDRLLRLVRLGTEFLLQQRIEVAAFSNGGRLLGLLDLGSAMA